MLNPSDKLLTEIAKHTFELERVGNYLDKENRKEFLNLSSELEKIVKDYQQAKSKKANSRTISNIIIRGKEKIEKSYKLIKSKVIKETIDIGKVEDNFTAGIINRIVTGDSSINFVSKPVENSIISNAANNLIIEGAPQSEWWSRQANSFKGKFSDIIQDSFQRNLTLDETVRRIRGTKENQYKDGIIEIRKHQANALARTSIASIANKIREETFLANSDVISGAELLVMLDGRTSDICLSYAGSAWENVKGEWVTVKGDKDYRVPPFHFQCFIDPQTPILCAYGHKPIKDIKVGDMVLTHKDRFKKVTELLFRDTDLVDVVTVQYSTSRILKSITTTLGHPILANGDWVNIEDIKVGDKLFYISENYNQFEVQVTNTQHWKTQEKGKLYNFSVEDDESYVAKGVVVHNCRTTIIPTIRKLSELPKDKADSVLEENKETLDSLSTQKDADEWLKEQPIEEQKEILGGLFRLWSDDKVSVKKVVTQKGRVRTAGELERLSKKQGNLARQSTVTKRLEANDIASKKYANEVIENTLDDLYKLQQRVILESASNAERDKLGRIFMNAKPSDLEYGKGFKPTDLSDLLGTESKRLAFYTHTAKRFERTASFRKGDFASRKTSNLNKVDRAVLDDLIYKIETDSAISRKNKEILIKVSKESPKVIGTQRSVAIVRSLLTQARKKDFSEIDNYVAYNNNAVRNAINEHFEVVIRKERRITDNTEKTTRFNASSEVAKSEVYAEINNPGIFSDSIDLKDANKIRTRIERIGSRNLRSFSGETVKASNVNLEITDKENISLYLSHIYKNGRLGAKAIDGWAKRVSEDSLHKKRVDYIAERTALGEPALINDNILKSPLFKEWENGVWSGRGFSEEVKKEIGAVLVDAEIKQSLKGYLKNKAKDPDIAISKYIEDSGLIANKLSMESALNKVNKLYNLDGKDRVKLRAERELDERNKIAKIKQREDSFSLDSNFITDFFKEGNRKQKVEARQEKAQLSREEIEELIKEDDKYNRLITKEIDSLVSNNRLHGGSEFFKEANSVVGIESKKVASLVTKEVLKTLNKGQTYTSSLESLGNQYYSKFLGVIEPDKIDSIRMGHFLTRSVIDAKLVKLNKSQNVYTKGFATVVEDAYQLEVLDKKWLKSISKNKNNYDIDGLPSLTKPRVIKTNETIDGIEYKGTYSDGTSLIKTREKKWAADKVEDDQNKAWVKNLEYESSVEFRVNNYVYDVMEELDRRGDEIIPKKILGTDRDRTLRNRFDITRQIAKNVRDDKFYNPISADKYGRTYTNNVFLSGQGDDVAKGLLKFSDSVELGEHGYKSFSRVFANTAGFDKVPMRSRIKILDKIDKELIIKTVENPIKYDWWRKKTDWIETGVIKNTSGIKDNKVLIQLAKNADPSDEGAFQFLALLEEKARMIGHVKAGKKINTFKSSLSMPSDGTVNVLQHMAAISRDKKLAKLVNLTSTIEVEDAYIAFRSGTLDEIGRKMEKNNPLKDFILLPEHIPFSARRKSVKQGMMIQQYNAGASTIGHTYFKEMTDIYEKLAKSSTVAAEKLEYQRLHFAFKNAKTGEKVQIGRIISRATETEFPQAAIVRADLNKLAEAHHISGKRIELTNDTGFPFLQDYRVMETQQLRLGTGKSRINLSVQVPTETIDFAKQDIGFTPNFIHGYGDATHKSMTAEILRKKGIKSFVGIHDSFGTHAGYSKELNDATKQAFKKIYKDKNIIKIMFNEFKNKGIKMESFQRNAKGQKITIKPVIENRADIPENMKEQYSYSLLRGWVYQGKSFKENGKIYATESIDIKDIGKQGDYNFDDLDNSLYFFH